MSQPAPVAILVWSDTDSNSDTLVIESTDAMVVLADQSHPQPPRTPTVERYLASEQLDNAKKTHPIPSPVGVPVLIQQRWVVVGLYVAHAPLRKPARKIPSGDPTASLA